MATYRTVSKFSELTGSMEVVGGVVKSYISDDLEQGTVTSEPSFGLRFTVSFPASPSKDFKIIAYGFPGVGYLGAAKDTKVIAAAEETWAATAMTYKMFEDEDDEYTDKASDDNVTTAAV